jgi:hypothetical protein
MLVTVVSTAHIPTTGSAALAAPTGDGVVGELPPPHACNKTATSTTTDAIR